MFGHKTCCKLELYYVRYSPAVIALLVTLNNFLNIDSPELSTLDYLCLPSVFTVINMYLLRSVFKLCKFHKTFVDYVATNVAYRIIHLEIRFIPDDIWFVVYLITLIYFTFRIIDNHRRCG